MTSKVAVSEEMGNFIKEYKDDYYCLRLILLFADHPYMQFDEVAIVNTLSQDDIRGHIRKALSNFVEKGIIRTQTGSRALFYSLPEHIRGLVSELAKLSPSQRQQLLK